MFFELTGNQGWGFSCIFFFFKVKQFYGWYINYISQVIPYLVFHVSSSEVLSKE